MKPYDRAAALRYAEQWALRRNPDFFDFEELGGDCTNFASQCLYAGSRVMNFAPLFGWFYRSAQNRTPSWTGVTYLFDFLTRSQPSAGPFGVEAEPAGLEVGDLVQLGDKTGRFYHSPVVTGFSEGQLLVSAHSFDALNRPLESYAFDRIRGIHILGVNL